MILTIDWSALVQNRLYSLLSGDMPLTRATDTEELKYRIARRVFEILDTVKPDSVIIAKDNRTATGRNYWRSGYLDLYYKNNTELFVSDSLAKYYVRFDNQLYNYNYLGATLEGKVNKKDTPADLEPSDSPITPKEIVGFCPKYKGNRSGREWVFETTEEEIRELFNQTALDLTAIIPNCRIVDAELSEADDIAGVITHFFRDQPQVMATVDSDWYQLINKELNHQVYNIAHMEYVDVNTDQAADDLQLKYVMGDSGDGISGCYIDGKSGRLGVKKAKAVIEAGEVDSINKAVYTRNQKLIGLDCNTIPKIVQRYIMDAYGLNERKLEPTTWEDLTLGERERKVLTKGSILEQVHEPYTEGLF